MRFFARIWMQTDLSALVSTVPLLRTTSRFKFASAALLGLGGSFVPNSLVTVCVWPPRCCMRLHSVDRELPSDCGVDDRHVTSHGSRPRQPVRTDRPRLRHPCPSYCGHSADHTVWTADVLWSCALGSPAATARRRARDPSRSQSPSQGQSPSQRQSPSLPLRS